MEKRKTAYGGTCHNDKPGRVEDRERSYLCPLSRAGWRIVRRWERCLCLPCGFLSPLCSLSSPSNCLALAPSCACLTCFTFPLTLAACLLCVVACLLVGSFCLDPQLRVPDDRPCFIARSATRKKIRSLWLKLPSRLKILVTNGTSVPSAHLDQVPARGVLWPLVYFFCQNCL